MPEIPGSIDPWKGDLIIVDQVSERCSTILWASGPILGTGDDAPDIADAILKVHENRDTLSSISWVSRLMDEPSGG